MSITDKRQSLAAAMADAEAFRALFNGCYERWEIAGSIRRKKQDVADVDHVIIPTLGDMPGAGLFADQVNLLWHRAEELLKADAFKKHVYHVKDKGAQHKWGESRLHNGREIGSKLRGFNFRGFKHEIWLAHPSNWGAILLIRTGPSDFSKWMVSQFLAGRLYRQDGGELIHVATGNPVSIPDEATYFGMLGMAYIPPEHRTAPTQGGN